MELPDMELAKRSLSRTKIYHRSINKAIVFDHQVAEKISPEKLEGQKVKKMRRRGKYLIMELETGSLLFHGGMTGKFAVLPEEKDLDHVVLELVFNNGVHFYFQNPRKFGKCLYRKDWKEELSDLGIDPLGKRFTYKNFKEALTGHRGSIKPFLQKQEYIAGLGNIYIDESLWEAKIHPLAKMDDLNTDSIRRLYKAVSKVCRWAMKKLRPPVATAGHAIGEQPDFLKVYGRKGEPCKRCKHEIKKRHVSQRVTYYCPNCQKK